MCCGGTNKTTSTQSSNAGPQAQSAIARANTVSQTPYTPYGGQMVAGFNPQQNQAFNMANNTGIGSPYIAQAAQYAQQGATPISAADITNNLNQTGLDQQVTALQNLFNQQNATANSTVTGNAALQHALGGDRVGVAQALTQQANTLAQAPTLANAYNTAYGQAAQLAQGNQQAAANAAYTYGNLGQEAQNQQTTDIQNLLTTGGLQQQLDQANLNWNYQNNYLNPQAWPYQNAQWYAGILSSLGGLTGSQSSTTQPSPSIWSQLLGAGSAGLGAYMASDANLKENISDPVGTLNDGTPVRTFNFKGDNTPHMGVIAQEAELVNPSVVASDPATGVKMVDYSRVGRHGLGEGFASGGAVDPDFQRLTDHLGHAVKHVQAALPPPTPQAFASGGSIIDPTRLQAAPLTISQPQASNPIPNAASAGGSGGMVAAPNAATPDNTMGQSLNRFGQGLGTYLSKPATPAYYEAGSAANGGWTTTATPSGGFWNSIGSMLPFADGGEVEPQPMAGGGQPYYDDGDKFYPRGAPVARSLADIDAASPARGIFSTSAEAAPASASETGITPFANNDPGTTKIVPDAPLPPNATEYSAQQSAPVAASAPEVLPWANQTSSSDSTQSPDSAQKAWYEYGSNPMLGMALMKGGAQAMAGTSPFAGVNLGQGLASGVDAYVQQQQIERQAKVLEVQAARQAEIERHNRAAEALQLSAQPKWTTDQFGRLFNQRTGEYRDNGIGSSTGSEDLPSGEEFLKQVPPNLRNEVKGISEYRSAPMPGQRGAAIMSLVQQYNPQYDARKYPVAQAVMKDFSQAGQTGKALYSAGTSLRHLDGMRKAYEAMGNYQGPFSGAVNAVRGAWKNDVSSDKKYQAALRSFEFHKEALSTELDKAFKGSGSPDVTGIEGIKKNFSASASPADFAGGMSAAAELLKGRFDGAAKAWEDAVGSPMPHELLDKDTQAIYENLLKGGVGHGASDGNANAESSAPLTKKDILALPDNSPVTLGGKNYIKRGSQLIPAEGTP